ncbi:hypothetical protein FCM35_KLT20245 [Carex littledalei]|uniref:Uncharacterized protein n=1 Tax=Carex littledalei TaxID=544730 RepID=A0A833RIF6_9POAL|nr:hypothetical protein FCM35_KLT20245 [Carex littledalei]
MKLNFLTNKKLLEEGFLLKGTWLRIRYAVGGFDGEKMVPGVEIFDLRFPSWIPGMPMRKPRGYAVFAIKDDTFYMMGETSNRSEVTEIVHIKCF